MQTKGNWWFYSPSDPRWNCHGQSDFVGGFTMPKEAKVKLGELEAELKQPHPADLEFGYMKD